MKFHWKPKLGVQLVAESDEFNFDLDLLDATKIIPEEQVPVRPVGKMVLNRNPDNFFAGTEQVAFHTANVVPGEQPVSETVVSPVLSQLNTATESIESRKIAVLVADGVDVEGTQRFVEAMKTLAADGYAMHFITRSADAVPA